MNQRTLDLLFAILLAISQIIAVVFYGIYFRHVTPKNPAIVTDPTYASSTDVYTYFQDIHIMIYVGFGFLLTSFHKFRLTSLTMCFWVSAIAVQYYFLFNAMWIAIFKGESVKFNIGGTKLVAGEVSAGAILIALCAIIGKTNNFQFLVITIFGSLIYTLNEEIVIVQLKARDVGGAMIIHAFGAFYGIGISSVMRYANAKGSKNFVETQDSLSMAMVGTLFLWCFWPSFNAILANSADEVHMAVLNTYFSLIGSVACAYVTSILLGHGKFTMSQILNATLAGGVVMGSSADILYDGWVAYLVGCLTGVISCLLFAYAPKLFEKLNIQDIAGVFNLHGVPGLIGGLISAIFRAAYIDDKGGKQVAGTFISLGISLTGGIVVGFVIRAFHSYESPNDYFNDKTNVVLEEEVVAVLSKYGAEHGTSTTQNTHHSGHIKVQPALFTNNEQKNKLHNEKEEKNGLETDRNPINQNNEPYL